MDITPVIILLIIKTLIELFHYRTCQKKKEKKSFENKREILLNDLDEEETLEN